MSSRSPWGFAAAAYHRARRVTGDPRLAGVLRAGPRVASFLVRGWARSAGAAEDDSIVPVRPTAGLAVQALLDEVLIAVFRHPDLLPRPGDYEPSAADLASTRALFEARGWLAHPGLYHREPGTPEDVRSRHEHALGLGYEHVTFTSGWEPDPEEPGRSRWLDHEANRSVHAWLAPRSGT